MKHLKFLLLAILISSCCGTKKVIENTPQEVTQIPSKPAEIFINTFANNYSPLEIEEKITIPIESVLNSMDELGEINAVSELDYSKIKITFNSNVSLEKALDIVKNKIDTLIANNGLPITDNQKITPKISDYNNFDESYTSSSFEVAETEVEEKNNKAIIIGDTTTIKMPGLVVGITKKDSIISSKHTPHHDRWLLLLGEHVSDNGNVDYESFKKSKNQLKDYINYLSKNLPTEDWAKEDKLAYWINAYNAMTVDLIIRNYPIKSIKDIKYPWEQRLWKLGKKWYNLDEIEHQILRKMNEPRIHFAIVCASYSCPKLQNEAFTALQLEEQLTNATKEFLADTNRNNITQNSLRLSKIFQWFAKDFKQNGSLIDFLNKYTEIDISSKAKKSFKNYNWDLND